MPVLIYKKYKGQKKWYIIENSSYEETQDNGVTVTKKKRDYLETLGIMTKTEAKNRLTEYIALNKGSIKTDITFRILMDEFKDFYLTQVGQTIKQKTYGLFSSNADKMLGFFDRALVKKIEFNNIEAFKLSLKNESSLSNRSINIMLTDLKKVLGYAVDRGWINSYPNIKRVSEQKINKTIKYLTTDELETILEYADEKRTLYIQLMIYTGMRPWEASNLKWSEVDLLKKHIDVLSDNPKKKGRRIPIHPKLLDLLEIARANQELEDNVSPYTDSQVAGKSMKRLRALVKDKTKKDIECNPYKFRKTFGSLLAQQGVDTINVAHLMGHSKLQTTYQYYINQNEENLRKTIEKL